jgi:hypothetical protein
MFTRARPRNNTSQESQYFQETKNFWLHLYKVPHFCVFQWLLIFDKNCSQLWLMLLCNYKFNYTKFRLFHTAELVLRSWTYIPLVPGKKSYICKNIIPLDIMLYKLPEQYIMQLRGLACLFHPPNTTLRLVCSGYSTFFATTNHYF